MGRAAEISRWFFSALLLSSGCGRIGYDPLLDATSLRDAASVSDAWVEAGAPFDGDLDDSSSGLDASRFDGSEQDSAFNSDVIEAGMPDSSGFDSSMGLDASASDASSIVDAFVSSSCLEYVGSVRNTVGSLCQSVAASGEMAYLGLTAGAHGLQIFDVSDPSMPNPRGVFRTDSGPGMLDPSSNDVLGIAVRDRFAYLATYLGGFVIVDVMDPTAPRFVGALDLPSETWAIALKDDRAFLANFVLGIAVVDIADPSSPRLVTSLPVAGTAIDVHLNGNRLLVAAQSDFHVIDVTNPDGPARTGGLTTNTLLYETWSSGDRYAYVIDRTRRELLTIDVDVTPPIMISTRPPDDSLTMRCIDGNATSLIVGSGTSTMGGVRSFGLGDPTAPTFMTLMPVMERVYEVAVMGDLVFGAVYNGDLVIWRFSATCP